ncbi:MAG TPA: hypothetical protein VN915_03145 [Elusimicrobiota bacterium]|nr:hypothetical protein [Elusimicrobiota bacterium]
MRTRLRAFLIAPLLFAGCMWPSRYSNRRSGRILDQSGKPLPGTYIDTRVNKVCGSLGGRSTQIVKTAYTVTDPEGRYSRSISGVGMVSDMIIGGCGGFEFEDFACRPGYGCQLIRNDGDFTLTPGKDLSFMLFDMPQEIRAAMAGCPQEQFAVPQELPGWERGFGLQVRMYCTKDGKPSIQIAAPDTFGWVLYSPLKTGKGYGRFHSEWLPPGPYQKPPSGVSPTGGEYELFALAARNGILRPVAGVRWLDRDSPGLAVVGRYNWNLAWVNSDTSIPLDRRKLLPSVAHAPEIPPEVLIASESYRSTLMKEQPPGVPITMGDLPSCGFVEGTEYPVRYELTLKSSHASKVGEEAVRVLDARGARSIDGGFQVTEQDSMLGQMVGVRQSFELPLQTADSTVREISDLALLSKAHQYRCNLNDVDAGIKFLKDRLAGDPNAAAIAEGPGSAKVRLPQREEARRMIFRNNDRARLDLSILVIPR